MAMDIASRFKNAWNAFRDNSSGTVKVAETSTYWNPVRPRISRGGEKSIVVALYNRMAMDVAQIAIKHVRVDEENRYISDVRSDLNYCLQKEANIDQTGRAFIQDAVFSMFDEGCVALVPTYTDGNPTVSYSYDVEAIRVGKIVEWYPSYVKVDLYNDKTGKHENIILPKAMVAIVVNPFYAVMNTPNSTAQRLIRKLSLIDAVDEESSSGKLQMIIQLPYIVKSESRQQQAEKRRKEIERQLTESKFGIAYTDGTEKITQINRPLENNLQEQIEYLTNMLYGQLGLTPEILNGSADENTMLNYYNRTIEPICSALVEEMERKWLSRTARTQRQAIRFFRDPFKLVPVSQVAEMADKFTRNEIMTSNEFRQVIGMKPSDDPKADQLVNANIAQANGNGTEPMAMMDTAQMPIGQMGDMASEEDIQAQINEIDAADAELAEIEQQLGTAETEEPQNNIKAMSTEELMKKLGGSG